MRDDPIHRAIAYQGERRRRYGSGVDLPRLNADTDDAGDHQEHRHPPARGEGSDGVTRNARLRTLDFLVGGQQQLR